MHKKTSVKINEINPFALISESIFTTRFLFVKGIFINPKSPVVKEITKKKFTNFI